MGIRNSLSSIGNIVSITVRKNNSNSKSGIKFKQDSEGQVTVKEIAKNGLFASSGLEIGDTILSVNRRKLRKDDGLDELMKEVDESDKISVSVRKKVAGKEENDCKNSSVGESDASEKKNPNFVTTISAEKKNNEKSIGLILKKKNERSGLVVSDVKPKSIFSHMQLNSGDVILSINDVSFRTCQDPACAIHFMEKARLMINLEVVKKEHYRSLRTLMFPSIHA